MKKPRCQNIYCKNQAVIPETTKLSHSREDLYAFVSCYQHPTENQELQEFESSSPSQTEAPTTLCKA